MGTTTLEVEVVTAPPCRQMEAYALQEGFSVFHTNETIDSSVQLGSGGFGDVYALGESHVLKVYKRSSLDTIKQAKRELHMNAFRYKHKNIITCLGVLIFDDTRHNNMGMIFERGGEELFNILVRLNGTLHDLYFKLYKLYLRDMFCGLAFLRENDIIHCDIKLENLLVTANRLQIADFGFAHSAKWPLLSNCTMSGTPGYVPHLALAQDPKFAHRRDPWAAACVVFALTYGGMLYEHSGTREYDKLLEKLRRGDTETPFSSAYSGLSPRLVGEEIMTHLMFETEPSFKTLHDKLV